MSGVLIVGGGPAGSVTGLHLARAGREVTLVDRAEFPRPKSCGECLNPGVVAELRTLGLDGILAEFEPGVLRGWELQTPSGRILRAGFGAGVHTWTLDRSRLDRALLEAAEAAGARVRTGVSFEGIENPDRSRENGRRRPDLQIRLRNDDGSRTLHPTSLLVGADGLHSRVRRELPENAGPGTTRLRKAGLSLHLAGVDLDPAWGRLVLDPTGTIGLSALDPAGERWTLVHVVPDGGALPDGPDELLERCGRVIPELAGARPESEMLGSGGYDQPVERPWGPGILLVGDAAGYYDPVTGQGIGRALRSARWAAESVLGGGGPDELRRYGVRLRHARRDAVRVQRIIERVTRRPRLLERLLPAMEMSGLLDTLVEVTGDRTPASRLWHPTLWPRWGRTLFSAVRSRN